MTDWNSRIKAEWFDDSRVFTVGGSHTGQTARSLENFEPVTSVVISLDSEIAATHSKTAITLWDIAIGEKIPRFNVSPSETEERIETKDYVVVQFSPSGQLVGQLLASWNDPGILSVWHVGNGHEINETDTTNAPVVLEGLDVTQLQG